MFRMRLTCALALLFGLTAAVGVFAQNAGDKRTEPDVLILVNSAQDGGLDQVSITFPNKIDHAVAKSYLTNLLRETGWEGRNPNISDEEGLVSGKNVPMTSISFASRFAVLRSEHNLRVAPIVKAFRDRNQILIYYMVAPPFEYRGFKGIFEDPNVRIRADLKQTIFQYDVTVKRHDFTKIDLPEPTSDAPRGLGGLAGNRGHGLTLAPMIGLLLLALIGGAVAYFAAGRYINQGKSRQ